ncbi:MAG: hypothetical protein ACO1RX_04395 [Candidatus Sericytochromatia bacterium]
MSVENLPESLLEVQEKVAALGPIGTLITRTLKAVLQPDEQLLVCFHQLTTSEGAPQSAFGSLDLRLITSERFLSLGFYPTYHHFDVKDIHKIAFFTMLNRFSTGYEGEGDATTAEERGYSPLEIEVQIRFEDEHGQEVHTWNQDATRPEDIRSLFKQLPVLSRLVGKPLREAKA